MIFRDKLCQCDDVIKISSDDVLLFDDKSVLI